MRSLSLARRWRLLEAALSSCGWYAPPPPSGAAAVGDPEPVRAAMHALATAVPGVASTRFCVALRKCTDLQGLWYLRPTLMQVLAADRGETGAGAELARLDALFLQAWPAAPVARTHLVIG